MRKSKPLAPQLFETNPKFNRAVVSEKIVPIEFHWAYAWQFVNLASIDALPFFVKVSGKR